MSGLGKHTPRHFVGPTGNSYMCIKHHGKIVLLSLYGNEITLLDATYITTRYSLPLYFLCLPTNANYINVATFVTETEDSSSLIEALRVIKEWNPDWSLKYFMCDYANEEINALENVFPSILIQVFSNHEVL